LIYLQVADADDLPFGWKKAVSYVLTLEHPSGANLSYAKRNPDKTFKLCPKAIDWGWSQFITSDRIQQEGFVSDDSLTVRASVTVKSSSVSIDLEDAELYLKCAVEEGNAQAVKLCLAQGAGVNCKFKDDLYTPLHTACSSSGATNGSMQVLELLLERGADGNACNKWRETPLLIAANNGHRSAVEALLKSGADPSLCSEAGWSALTFAAHKVRRNYRIVSVDLSFFYIPSVANTTLSISSLCVFVQGYDDIVALLLRAGAPVNCRVTEDSSTPLHKACAGSKSGHLIAVKQLLEGGADVHALNKWRETPLLTAANHGQAGAVEALLKAGADPCKCTDTGWSPLSIAAYKGHDDVVKLLLEEGAPTEEADPTLSALLQAATKGLPGTVELLLRHGADHTVTTKKGDTALSILVEQNLIDAAVEMVTEYKASVPRCSRDRKKVQRARLLINLRVKQQQREGILNVDSDDDDDDDDETDHEDDLAMPAQHDESPTASTPAFINRKKKKKGKVSAEQQAKLAEEALLMELEEEDAKAKKDEHEANKKSAKKRKKKDRERQQKQKEEQERLEKEQKENAERQRRQKEKEDQERKQREKKVKDQREREMKEASEKLKIAAAKRKDREEQEARELETKLRQEKKEQAAAALQTSSPTGSIASEKRGKNVKAKTGNNNQVHPAPGSQAQTADLTFTARSATPTTASNAPALSQAKSTVPPKNRGWETKTQHNSTAAPMEMKQTPSYAESPSVKAQSHAPQDTVGSNSGHGLTGMGDFLGFDSGFGGGDLAGMRTQQQPQSTDIDPFAPSSRPEAIVNGFGSQYSASKMEVPALALFRREKVSELFQRCALARTQPASSNALNIVSEETIKKVVYRWMVRAAHESSAYLDCLIPSWIDFDQLTTFFQRQFISESRKGVNSSAPGAAMMSMESLREAGSAMAILCHSLAKEVANLCQRMDEQLPHDWSDGSIGMNASEAMGNGGGPMIVIDWANRSQIYLPAMTFSKLRDRYTGPTNRILSSLFIAKMRYDTKRLIVSDTPMDFRLSAGTLSSLANGAGVSAEIWSDPFSVQTNNVFWGQFEDVDSLFGGLQPFSKDGGRGEDLLLRHGGSVALLLPLDNMMASRYVHRMLDLLESADANRTPLSFSVFLHTECFVERTNAPSVDDLRLLDPRLNERSGVYVRRAETLPSGQHAYFSGDGEGAPETSRTGSMFLLLQNEAGRARFDVRDASVVDIIRSTSVNTHSSNDHFNDFSMTKDHVIASTGSYGFEAMAPISAPMSPTGHHAALSDYGTIGGTALTNAFTAAAPSTAPRFAGGRRGRLFDLVDDGEEDNLNDADAVAGMLNNLNVDLFQNNISNEMDVEAISLMGIGGPPPGSNLAPRSTSRHFG
jgi:ankyrin repeat protein